MMRRRSLLFCQLFFLFMYPFQHALSDSSSSSSSLHSDCYSECDMIPSMKKEAMMIVCGVNGVTYPNKCFAMCDKVELIGDGPCKDNIMNSHALRKSEETKEDNIEWGMKQVVHNNIDMDSSLANGHNVLKFRLRENNNNFLALKTTKKEQYVDRLDDPFKSSNNMTMKNQQNIDRLDEYHPSKSNKERATQEMIATITINKSIYNQGDAMNVSFSNNKGDPFNLYDRIRIVSYDTIDNNDGATYYYYDALQNRKSVSIPVNWVVGKFKVVLLNQFTLLSMGVSNVFEVTIPSSSVIINTDKTSYELGSSMFISWNKINGEVFNLFDEIRIVSNNITSNYSNSTYYYDQYVNRKQNVTIPVNWAVGGQFKIIMLVARSSILLCVSNVFEITEPVSVVVRTDKALYVQGSNMLISWNKTNGDEFNYFDKIRIVSYDTTENYSNATSYYSDSIINRKSLTIPVNWGIGKFKVVILLHNTLLVLGVSDVFEVTTSGTGSRPSSRPSKRPSSRPSKRPSSRPSKRPVMRPSSRPVTRPVTSPVTRPVNANPSTPSLPTAVPTPKRHSCLSGYNMVEVKDIGNIYLNQLKIGDMIRSSGTELHTNDSSVNTYSRVYSFGHYSHNINTEYIQLYVDEDKMTETQLQNPLEISSKHLIFVEKKIIETKNHIPNSNNYIIVDDIVPAGDIMVGDVLSGNKTVTSIQYINRTGVYAPITESGVLIVNTNIRVSSYVQLFDHDNNNHWLLSMLLLPAWKQHVFGHILCWPHRIICRYNIKFCKHYEVYTRDDNGYSKMAYWMILMSSNINFTYFTIIGWWIMKSITIVTFVISISYYTYRQFHCYYYMLLHQSNIRSKPF